MIANSEKGKVIMTRITDRMSSTTVQRLVPQPVAATSSSSSYSACNTAQCHYIVSPHHMLFGQKLKIRLWSKRNVSSMGA